MQNLVEEKFQDVHIPECAPDGSFLRRFECTWFACYCQYEDGTVSFDVETC